jgi:hypothetical protein
MAAYCMPARHATMLPDTVRDLAASLSLANGESMPLAGPPINFGPKLGPVWIWLQALVLPFSRSLTAVSIYVAIVASLKFPLLYLVGRTVADGRLGLCLAIALATPSVAVYQWSAFFHPNWVEAAISASLAFGALAWARRSISLAYVCAALLGLAIQLHPTALFYALALPWLLHAIGLRGSRLVAHLAVASGLVVAWFLPLVLVPSTESGNWNAGASRVVTA